MKELLPGAEPGTGSRGIRRAVVLYLITIALLNMVTGHNHRISLTFLAGSGYGTTLSGGLDLISGGTARRQIGFLLSGMLVLIGIWRLRLRPLRFRPLVTWLAGLLLLWCTLSAVWAVEPPLTVRRLGVLWLLVMTAAGVVSVTPRRFVPAFVGLTAFAYVIAGLGAELALGTFGPWRAGYRFAGTLYPTSQGINCAMVVLFGVWLLSGATGRRLRLAGWFLAGIGLGFLALTRARTPFAGVFGAAAILLVLRLRPGRRFVVAAAVLNVGILVVLLYANGLIDLPFDVLMLGRGSRDVTTLNSRLPLWILLGDYLEQRPMLGYGYSGFMTAEHALQIGMILEFGIAGAHSLYLEIMLGIGAIGLSLFVGLFVSAIGSSIRDNRFSPPESFFASVLIFELLVGVLDSSLVFPSWRLLPLVVIAVSCLSPGSPTRPPSADSRYGWSGR